MTPSRPLLHDAVKISSGYYSELVEICQRRKPAGFITRELSSCLTSPPYR
jgi:hypothetical protein